MLRRSGLSLLVRVGLFLAWSLFLWSVRARTGRDVRRRPEQPPSFEPPRGLWSSGRFREQPAPRRKWSWTSLFKPGNLLVLAAAALFLGWFLLLRPVPLGGQTSYVRVSGISMEPTLRSGDLAVLQKQSSYGRGDVVAFRVQGGVVIHRIVRETPEGFVTQGDNKNGDDPWRPTADDIVGRMWFSVPRAGLAVAVLQQPLPLAALAAGLAVTFALSGGRENPGVRPADRRRKRG